MANAELRIRRIWTADDGYTYHRIPGVIVTSRGTVIIYNEARRDASDWAMMDIFMQRSTDGGETFGPPIYLARGDEACPTVNNPVMMEDKNGRLHLLYCRDYTVGGGGAWHRVSDDDAVSWSEPRDITAATRPELHNAFAFGPGHGICTADGMLLVPIWMVLKEASVEERKHVPSVLHTFFSRDGGESWQLGERIEATEAVVSPNETVAAEREDGSILLTIRSMTTHRAKAASLTGTGGWSVPELDAALPDPKCFGSMIRYRGLGGRYALLHVNCACETARRNVVLRASFDGGESWPIARTIDAERGGYCDLAADERAGNIYVLYEEKAGADVYLARLTPDWLVR
ncbi:MAG: exo-alpha-sialidase [Clostridia bacterium]|nr:exo-alpha-sialidase [Clostridia bacterium]